MTTDNQIRIAVDYENNAERWWDAARRHRSGCPASCGHLLDGTGAAETESATVTTEDADIFCAWASSLPGWADGPDYARHPFTFNPAE